MKEPRYWTGTLAGLCLTTVLACSPKQQQTAERSEEQPAPEVQQEEATPIYKAAVPELPELGWRLTRRFNLPLNNPPVVPPAKAEFLREDDIVLGVLLGSEARAYPWYLLANYHAVNDYLDGEPIIVNLCEACNGGAAFHAAIDGTVIDIRPRGLKNGTWYGEDFQTGSLWYPFIGEAFEGPLKGTKLERIRLYFSSWKDWHRDHPNTTVAMTSDEVRYRPHASRSRMADATCFNPAFLERITNPKPNPNRDLLPGHHLVFGMIPGAGKTAKAYTLDSLGEADTLVQTKIEDEPVLLLLQNEYQIGAYRRILGGKELTFELITGDPLMMKDQFGNTWNQWGHTIKGKDHPSELALVDGYMAKWYEWVENFPDTELAKPE